MTRVVRGCDTAGVHPVLIDGPNLVLRELAEPDALAVHRWVGDPEVVRHVPLGPLDRRATVHYVAQLVTQARRVPRHGYTLAVQRRLDGEVIGTVSIEIDSVEHKRAELGYIFRRDAWGGGVATEAAGLARDFAFDRLGVYRLWAVCDPDNHASRRVLQKLGMQVEGRMRGDLLMRGERRDSVLHAMVVTDLPAGRHGAGVYL
jgi:RimJ/RimL family protein N-acetyltransferase